MPDGERIITVEDNAELRLQQPHVVTLEARPPNVEGKGEVTIRDLVRNSLRMRPDRIIVGEVRGAETVDMLQALNTGHEGSLVTLHANSCDDAIHRLATLASMSELQIPFEALRDQINSAIDVIVQVDRFADGGRRVSEVAVVASHRRETFRLASVMEFVTEPIGPDRRGHAARTCIAGCPRRSLRRLMLAGVDGAAGSSPAPTSDDGAPSCGRRANDLGVVGAAAAAGLRRGRRARAVAAAGRHEPQRRAGRARPRRRRRGGGRSLVRALDVALPPHRAAAASSAPRSPAPGVKLTPVELVGLVIVVVAASAGSSLSLLFARGLALVVARSAASILVARGLIERRRGKRREAFIEQLPEIARMLANGAVGGPLDAAGGARWPRASSPTRAAPSCAAWSRRCGSGSRSRTRSTHLRDRLPSREVAVLMTTIVIQQRAGGDTVRALGELAATLDARKDLRREIKTLLSGVVFTSYVVAGIGAGTILLLNFMSPGVTKEMTGSRARHRRASSSPASCGRSRSC